MMIISIRKLRIRIEDSHDPTIPQFGGSLHYPAEIVMQKLISATALAGFFGPLGPHFPGTRWITMFGKARKGGLDDVEPHECPIPRKSIRVSCLRVTTLHHRLGCLRLATRQSIIAIAKSHHEQELGCFLACVVWEICCRC